MKLSQAKNIVMASIDSQIQHATGRDAQRVIPYLIGGAGLGKTSVIQQIAEERHHHFLSVPIDVKVELLQQNYGVGSDSQTTILNLVIALKALIENNGILKSQMFTEGVNPILEIDLKRLEIEPTKNEAGQPMGRIVNDRKLFRDGEAIVFSDLEIQRTLVTIASFADALFKSVAGYAQSFNKKS